MPVPEIAAVFLPVALSAKTSASASGDSCAERSSRGFCSSSLPIILQSAAMLSWDAPGSRQQEMIFSEATWQAVSPSHLAEAVIPASSFSLSPSSLRWGNRHFAQAFHRKALAGNFSEYIADLARAVVIGGSSNEELQELAEKVSDSDPLWALTSWLAS